MISFVLDDTGYAYNVFGERVRGGLIARWYYDEREELAEIQTWLNEIEHSNIRFTNDYTCPPHHLSTWPESEDQMMLMRLRWG